MIDVAPSILSADFSKLKEDIDDVKDDIRYLHIDVMDGHFVPNITIGPLVIKSLRKHYDLIFDTHLMISNPLQYVEEFCKSGSDYVTVHIEANDPIKAIDKIHECGKKAGISIKPNTSVEAIRNILDKVEMVLVMSVEPGFGGQKFMPSALPKLKQLQELKRIHNYRYIISVDGGINQETAKLVIESGAEVCVAGSYVFGSKDRHKAIKSICEQ